MGALSWDWPGDTRFYFLLAPWGSLLLLCDALLLLHHLMKKPDRQPISLMGWKLLEKMRVGQKCPLSAPPMGVARERSLSPSTVVTDLWF